MVQGNWLRFFGAGGGLLRRGKGNGRRRKKKKREALTNTMSEGEGAREAGETRGEIKGLGDSEGKTYANLVFSFTTAD